MILVIGEASMQCQKIVTMMSFNKTSQAVLLLHRWDLRYSWRTSLAGPSLPQSLTTQQEHLTTFLALPSRSILQRPAHSPSFMLLSTLMSGMPCSWQRAVISEDAQQSLSLVQGIARLSNTSGQTVSDHGLLQHLLDGGVDVHGAGHGGGGWNVISLNIRHGEFLDVALVVSLVEVNQAIL